MFDEKTCRGPVLRSACTAVSSSTPGLCCVPSPWRALFRIGKQGLGVFPYPSDCLLHERAGLHAVVMWVALAA